MTVQPEQPGIEHHTHDVDVFIDDRDIGTAGTPSTLSLSPSGRVEVEAAANLGALGNDVVVSLPFDVLAAFVDEVRSA
jgi:hypothetical protein